ncbi:hypothetical protein [Stigmatella aurantiaca]|uniref:Conserved uncharacterized protein n=1 Tax=Stigmatella aurantiaca (strain DW4/3-1) TaxID=378806 RepID=E3FCH8_STIAD|nr:hypothetical protein [Stigmatella aurantiaca]ADO71287.1 conserved uncharacterized protein [Stigmatella aurantiaca DW4/3-1]
MFRIDSALVVLLLALVGLCPEAQASARFEVDSPFIAGMDRSYVFYSPNRIRRIGDPEPSALVFEAQVAPNLYFPQLHIGQVTPGLGKFILSAILTPNIRLRMLSQESSPVIPPSFMPKVTLQLAHLWLPDMEEQRLPTSLRVGLVNLVLGHYSNGQAGCFYANQNPEEGCSTPEGHLPLNETSGDFSTNFLRLEVHGRLLAGVDLKNNSMWSIGANTFFEYNSSLATGGITPEMREVYGDGHVGVGALLGRIWYGHRFRLEGNLSTPYGESPRQPVTLTLEAAALPRWGSGFGAFVRYVHGQDYYNILFLERVRLVQFGLIFELGPGPRIQGNPSDELKSPQ